MIYHKKERLGEHSTSIYGTVKCILYIVYHTEPGWLANEKCTCLLSISSDENDKYQTKMSIICKSINHYFFPIEQYMHTSSASE